MTDISATPDLNDLQIPMDPWTQPFWDATARHELLVPRCADCGRYRWPPGPFCPACRSQRVDWVPAGQGHIYSFTIIPDRAAPPEINRKVAPAVIEFPEAGRLRIVAAIVDTPLDAIRIGVKVERLWSQAKNATVPVFKIV